MHEVPPPVLDPVTLGHKAALGTLRPAAVGDEHAITAEERVAKLNDAASMLGMYYKPYWIEAGHGIALPTRRDIFSAEDIEHHAIRNDSDLEFAGVFSGYSRIRLGKLVASIGLKQVTGLCVTFEQALILAGMDTLEDDYRLHVPILSVEVVDSAPHYL